eukprot:3933992-Rhodomonas_salina.5
MESFLQQVRMEQQQMTPDRMAEFIMFIMTKLCIDCDITQEISSIEHLTKQNSRHMKAIKLLFLRTLAVFTIASGCSELSDENTDAQRIALRKQTITRLTSGLYENDVSWMKWG